MIPSADMRPATEGGADQLCHSTARRGASQLVRIGSNPDLSPMADWCPNASIPASRA